jgi:hypothetical protein
MTSGPQTEAACLLQSGALYRQRVGLVLPSEQADLVFAGIKTGSFSVYFGDAPIYHFDLEGRWQRAYVEPTHYLRSLDTRVHAIDRVREGTNLVLRRRELEEAEIARLDAQVRGVALGLIGELDAGRLRREEPPAAKAQPLRNESLRDVLARIAAWDDPAWDAHRKRYRAAYGPLPFLPPECQNAVIVQATQGEAGFGGIARTTAAARSPTEFRDHVDRVVGLMGRRLLQSRVVFLAGTDALRQAPAAVLGYLETVGEAVFRNNRQDRADGGGEEEPQLRGIHALVDDFAGPLPDQAELRELSRRHLVHVSLGVESGSHEVRAVHGKRWENSDLRRFAGDLRSAGIGLSILTLVGAGGPGLADDHVGGTVQLMECLELKRGEIVYLLDERELAPAERSAPDAGFPSDEAWISQRERLKEALAPLRGRGVKVLPYSLEKQWW